VELPEGAGMARERVEQGGGLVVLITVSELRRVPERGADGRRVAVRLPSTALRVP
jgi:hypothetical protein